MNINDYSMSAISSYLSRYITENTDLLNRTSIGIHVIEAFVVLVCLAIFIGEFRHCGFNKDRFKKCYPYTTSIVRDVIIGMAIVAIINVAMTSNWKNNIIDTTEAK